MSDREQKEAGGDPLWYKDAIIYQLHLKSFFDSNDDGIGDFAGLISKLDYIVSIGVNTIWLLPFYPSPRRDDGYDIAEYRAVHPEYGRMADVKRLIEEAHKRGLRIITELVINHTSDQHVWFQRARLAKPGSAARNFYVWSDTDKAYAGTRIIFIDTEKSNWTWDPVAKAYYWHRFYAHQPDLNFDNPKVMGAVLRIMRFWLDLGIDGLRLDAIPYLIEREGTNNENLPETHEVLRKIRAEMDRHYKDRLLLAEANQWPEDTQYYFGDGDECHMAFHFPLMPRMYMAIAQEDRFPITDIMRQTPDIPPNCQWAIFLRNHDELTLEMVSDKERDYLWNFYAADRRARLNLGIRRRLAPLLERDRRRIELMKCLLLTMPGTPVIYYGDEIGMGDNIHLGDRDGVRTPMQWSPDRNGGFSRADPHQLVLPPIMDPLYGYQAVNVEAQSRDPHSLLNWFRKMMVVRRAHRAFGRGSLRFLRPQNRKILAYLREYEGETILCVANISRSAQAVELDLAEFNGRIPVELSNGTAFPQIGQLTYLLTLPPYGFSWFMLSEQATAPSWSTATSGPVAEHYTFVLRRALDDILHPAARQVLENEVLPAYVPPRRWFQNKDQVIGKIGVNASGALGDHLYLELGITNDERIELYALPLAASWEDQPTAPFEVPLALARIRRAGRVGLLTDAMASAAFNKALLTHLRAGSRLPLSDGGALVFVASPALAMVDVPEDGVMEWPNTEQSNSSAINARRVVIKLIRRLVAGEHPEVEMLRYLTEHEFTGTPNLLGEIVREFPGEGRATLAIAQEYVLNQGNGWDWTIDALGRLIDDHATRLDAIEIAEDAFASYVLFAEALGRRLAQMHMVLAKPSSIDAFTPETVSRESLTNWEAATRRQLNLAIEVATRATGEENRAFVAEAEKQIVGTSGVLAGLIESAIGLPVTRIHGDLHLGQILVVAGDAMIIDFEGEPIKTLSERRQKSSPLRDVAGLLRSFDYAVTSVQVARATTPQPLFDQRADELLLKFHSVAVDRFMESYALTRGYSFSDGERRLLALFMLEKAAYEVVYEASNRPAWLGVPLSGLVRLLQEMTSVREPVHA